MSAQWDSHSVRGGLCDPVELVGLRGSRFIACSSHAHRVLSSLSGSGLLGLIACSSRDHVLVCSESIRVIAADDIFLTGTYGVHSLHSLRSLRSLHSLQSLHTLHTLHSPTQPTLQVSAGDQPPSWIESAATPRTVPRSFCEGSVRHLGFVHTAYAYAACQPSGRFH